MLSFSHILKTSLCMHSTSPFLSALNNLAGHLYGHQARVFDSLDCGSDLIMVNELSIYAVFVEWISEVSKLTVTSLCSIVETCGSISQYAWRIRNRFCIFQFPHAITFPAPSYCVPKDALLSSLLLFALLQTVPPFCMPRISLQLLR